MLPGAVASFMVGGFLATAAHAIIEAYEGVVNQDYDNLPMPVPSVSNSTIFARVFRRRLHSDGHFDERDFSGTRRLSASLQITPWHLRQGHMSLRTVLSVGKGLR